MCNVWNAIQTVVIPTHMYAPLFLPDIECDVVWLLDLTKVTEISGNNIFLSQASVLSLCWGFLHFVYLGTILQWISRVSFWCLSAHANFFQLAGGSSMAFLVRYDSAAVTQCSECFHSGYCYKCFNPACQRWYCDNCDFVHCCHGCGGNYCAHCRPCYWCAWCAAHSGPPPRPHPLSVKCACGDYLDLVSVLAVFKCTSFFSFWVNI